MRARSRFASRDAISWPGRIGRPAGQADNQQCGNGELHSDIRSTVLGTSRARKGYKLTRYPLGLACLITALGLASIQSSTSRARQPTAVPTCSTGPVNRLSPAPS